MHAHKKVIAMKRIILTCAALFFSLSLVSAQEEEEEVFARPPRLSAPTEPVSAQEDKIAVVEDFAAPVESKGIAAEEWQEYELRPLTLGVTVGANMSTYLGSRDTKMGLGAQIGINCDIPISRCFSIMPELIFAYKTVDINDIYLSYSGGVSKRIKTTDKLLYMNVPINVKGSFSSGPGRPFFAIGPMISVGLYGVNKAGDVNILLFQADPELDRQEKPFYNNLDIAANLKIGYDFDFGLAISIGSQIGLFNMIKETKETVLPSNVSPQRIGTLFVTLGYNW
jgi:hypothetical protein